jgi:hypothetical protein
MTARDVLAFFQNNPTANPTDQELEVVFGRTRIAKRLYRWDRRLCPFLVRRERRTQLLPPWQAAPEYILATFDRIERVRARRAA